MASILIIDDDIIICSMLSEMIQDLGHSTEHCQSLKKGLDIAASKPLDIIFLDVRLPDGNGLEAIPDLQNDTMDPKPEIIIMTGLGDADGAEMAINSGAWDYIQKASSIKEMRLSFTRALEYREQKTKFKSTVALKRDEIIGSSNRIQMCLDIVAQAANSKSNVHITGETGTGKELFANAIHMNSSRADTGDFVVVDCTALPDTLVESILFGHEKGAFTGADSAKEGLIKQADQGTLFLDEVGELPLSVQKSFLRVLQEHSFRPLGGKKEVSSDFRLVSATNRDLEDMVKKGQFREDLLFRLRTINVELPPLRERTKDISEIFRYQATNTCRMAGIPEKGFSDTFFSTLLAYSWPGNVRELMNTMEKVLAEAGSEPIIFERHLPASIRVETARKKIDKNKKETPPSDQSLKFQPDNALPNMQDFLDIMRKDYLSQLMETVDWKIPKACDISGLSRARIYQLLKKYDVSSTK